MLGKIRLHGVLARLGIRACEFNGVASGWPDVEKKNLFIAIYEI